jgi:hypothetical protein
MNEKLHTDLVASQIRTIRIETEINHPDNKPLIAILSSTLTELEKLQDRLANGAADPFAAAPAVTHAPVEPTNFREILDANPDLADIFGEAEVVPLVVPENMSEENYRNLIEDNFDEETAQRILENGGIPVAGLVPNENGELVEVGNFDESADEAEALVADFEEENGEERIPENLVTVRYSRLDGQELTEEDTKAIIEHPISENLKRIGDIYLRRIQDTEQASTKDAVFIVAEENKNMLKTLAYNVAVYKGIHVFPGLGRVQAVGNVNFL